MTDLFFAPAEGGDKPPAEGGEQLFGKDDEESLFGDISEEEEEKPAEQVLI